MDRRAWWATGHGFAELDTKLKLNTSKFFSAYFQWTRPFSSKVIVQYSKQELNIDRTVLPNLQALFKFHQLSQRSLPLLGSLMAQTVKNLPAVWETWIPSPELGESPGGGKSYPLQYSGLENSVDRGVWWATVHGLTKSHGWVTFTFTFITIMSLFLAKNKIK